MPYKQIFTRLYDAANLGDQSLEEALALLPDGRLSVGLAASADVIDIGINEAYVSTEVLSGDEMSESAETPDGRYFVEVATYPHEGTNEYWLSHTDQANGKFKRAKLNTEWRTNGMTQPRVVVSPGGSYFIVDDSGTVRLYSAPHLLEAGAFQVAHINTENRIVALAVSTDERLIVGLSAWKDIVLYSVADRRVAFVRQIRDEIGWYDPNNAHIMLVGNAEAIVTIGIADRVDAPDTPRVAVNAFKQVQLKATLSQ